MVTIALDDNDTSLFPGKLSVGSHGYAQTYLGGRVVLAHRVILGLTHGDGRIGDHINGDKLDNRRANLRVVTPGESSANVRGRAFSGFRGVYPNKRRWAAAAKQHGRKIHLGTYDTPEEAYAVSTAWRRQNLPGWVDR